MELKRIFRHFLTTGFAVRKLFPVQSRQAIEQAIRESESKHAGELRFAVEAALDMRSLLRAKTAHERALEVFSQLRVWDTEANTGVLIYLLLADRHVEIVADRGINRQVDNSSWEAICRDMNQAFQQGRFEEGAVNGIRAISTLLECHFPAPPTNPNELPDQVELI